MEQYVPGQWKSKVFETVLQPAIERSTNHAFFKEAAAGTLPVAKVAKWCADMLWITVRFPNIIAALASRVPEYEHGPKALMLANAYEERNHPPMLARSLQHLGIDAARILNGPTGAYTPSRHAEAILDFLTAHAYHHPFIEGICGIGVGMEALTPHQCEVMYKSLKQGYGFPDEALEWLLVHCGEVEKAHAATALMVADMRIGNNEAVRARCAFAIQRGAWLVEAFPDAMYAYDGPMPSA
jgi:pyrroloquinoline quinone (PQQ) biosynthesis protein C